jgi:hypothetical protein
MEEALGKLQQQSSLLSQLLEQASNNWKGAS